MSKWIAFFGCIKHEYFNEVKDVLMQYPNEGYIISKEISLDAHKESEGQHMHFIVKMTEDDYHRFAKRIFKQRFGLRGRAQTDLPRQYGKVKHIENLERMKAYTLKDGHFETNLSEEEIVALQQLAHKKEHKGEFYDNLMKFLSIRFTNDPYADKGLSSLIIEYFIHHGEGRDPSRPAIERYSRLFITYFSSLSTDQKIEYLKLYL